MTANDYVAATSRGGAILVAGLVSIIIAVGAIAIIGRKLRKDEEPEQK